MTRKASNSPCGRDDPGRLLGGSGRNRPCGRRTFPNVSRRAFLWQVAAIGASALIGRTAAGFTRAKLAGGAEPWTHDEIAGRLGISTTVFQKVRLGARQIAAIRTAGIARIELLLSDSSFDYRNQAQMAEVLSECNNQGAKVVSVHGSLAMPYETEDEARRARRKLNRGQSPIFC